MRETFRAQDNKSYWTQRWESIDADDVMLNENIYPLKYAIEAISSNSKKQKILEAGCGAGRILNYFHQKDYNIVGIDFIESAINKIKNKNKNINVHTMDILNTNFKDQEFDTILSFGLYHNFQIENLKKSLNETKRILSNNGILCFSDNSAAVLPLRIIEKIIALDSASANISITFCVTSYFFN